MSLSNSVTTELIDCRSHSNQRTEFRLDDAYYSSSLKLVNVGLIASKNPQGPDAGANSASTIYPQINGVMQCIRNIYLYSGTTLLDSVQNCAQYSAIQALKTPNQGSMDLNRDLILNGMGFSQSPIPIDTNIGVAARKPETLCTQDQSLKAACKLTNTSAEIPANNQCPIAGQEDGASGSVMLSQLLQMLDGMSVLPRLPNLRLLIEWDTNLAHYPDLGTQKNTSLSVIRPTLVAEKILGMPDETPDLAVPYMSTIVERFNIPKAHGAAVTSTALAADPFALTNGSAEVTVTISADQAAILDLRQNEPVTLAGGAAIQKAAQNLGNNPIATGAGAGNTDPLTVTLAAHGYKAGDIVTFAGLTTVDTAVLAAGLNANHTVLSTNLAAGSFEINMPAGSSATAGGTAGGGAGGSSQLEEAFAAADVDGDYIIKSVAANQQTFVIDFDKASNFTSAGAGGGGITVTTVLDKTSITRQSHRSQAFTNKFVRELVLFNLTSGSLPAADQYVTQQTRSPAQVNEVLQMVVNNVNHIPDQGISSEALRCLYLNSAQPSLNVPFIAMLGDSGAQRLAVADQTKAMIYPHGALRNNFSITAAKIGKRVDDLRFEHQRTYGARAGSHDAYVLLCFGTVARTLTVKNGILNVSY